MRKTYVVGGQGFVDELNQAGIQCVQTSTNTANGVYDIADFPKMSVDTSIDAVVVGWDICVDYQKLCYASVLLQMGKKYIASNPDIYDPMTNGIIPGNGTVLEALNLVSGKQPEIVGKPHPTQVNTFMEDKGLGEKDKSRILVIGDRLDTDIALGKNANVDAALVLTGINTLEDVEKAEKSGGIVPNYILTSLQF